MPKDIPIKRRNLVSAIATGERTIVAGAYDRGSFRVLPYSPGGTAVFKNRCHSAINRRPDALMPASASFVHGGIYAAGSRSGASQLIGGTSVAAPQLTRYLVDHLDSFVWPGGARRKLAIAAAVHDWLKIIGKHSEVGLAPADRGGHGRLNPVVDDKRGVARQVR